MSKFCSNCGTEIEEGVNICSNCGNIINKPQDNNIKEQTNGFAIAGFVLSLVSLVCCGFTSILGIIFSIIGLTQSKNMNGNGKGLSIAGIIISSIVIILYIIVIVLYVLGITGAIMDSF